MDHKIVKQKTDLTFLNWSNIRSSSGTAGTFLKSESSLNGEKIYYKLSNSKKQTLRIAPLFDHGLSLLYSCLTDEQVESFDIMEDKRCQNFIGGYSCNDNLSLVDNMSSVFQNKLTEGDKDILFDGLHGILSNKLMDKIWDMIFARYRRYEKLFKNEY